MAWDVRTLLVVAGGLPRRHCVTGRVGDADRIDELFAALADPTRRDVLERLVHDGPQTATALAHQLPDERAKPIVKHLRALADADLVAADRSGREVHYRATTERLALAVDWLLGTSADWDRRAGRLQAKMRR